MTNPLMTITPETTVAELGKILKETGVSFRVCQMGTGFVVFMRGFNRDGMGYGTDFYEAIKMASRDHQEKSPAAMNLSHGERH